MKGDTRTQIEDDGYEIGGSLSIADERGVWKRFVEVGERRSDLVYKRYLSSQLFLPDIRRHCSGHTGSPQNLAEWKLGGVSPVILVSCLSSRATPLSFQVPTWKR